MATKRTAISKRTRFEVFKRDQFKCVYCGDSAPHVVLHVDHVKPVAKGGTNNILNLVTSCESCNGGKSDVELSDSSAIEKQRRQAEELQAKKEQLKMMAEWVSELGSLTDDSVDVLEKHWFKDWPNDSWSVTGRKGIEKLLKSYSIAEIVEAMDISKEKYIADFESEEERVNAYFKIGAILTMKKRVKEDPLLKDAFYCRAVLKNRITFYKPDWQVLNWVKELIEFYGAEPVTEFCKKVKNWNEFKNAYEAMLEE